MYSMNTQSSKTILQPEPNNDESRKLQNDVKQEAYEHAKKCIEIAPDESIGYGAVLTVHHNS